MKPGGDGPNPICQGLTGDMALFCEIEVEKQCLDPVEYYCAQVHPDNKGKQKKAYNECVALQKQSQLFSVILPQISQTLEAVGLIACGELIAGIIRDYGVPTDFDAFDALDPFVNLSLKNVNKFAKSKERMIVVVGDKDGEATLDFQKWVFSDNQGSAQFLFIDRNSKQAVKMMKKMGIYQMFNPEDPSPQGFDSSEGNWSVYFYMGELTDEAESEQAASGAEPAMQPTSSSTVQKQSLMSQAMEDAKSLQQMQKKWKMQKAMEDAKALQEIQKKWKMQQAMEDAMALQEMQKQWKAGQAQEPAQLPFIELKKKDFNTYFNQDELSGLVLVLDLEDTEHFLIYNQLQSENMFDQVGFTVLLNPKNKKAFKKLRALLAKKAPELKAKDIKAPGVYMFEDGQLFACQDTWTQAGWVCEAPEIIGPEPAPAPTPTPEVEAAATSAAMESAHEAQHDIAKIEGIKTPEEYATPPTPPTVPTPPTPPKVLTPDPQPGVAVPLGSYNFAQFFPKTSGRKVIVAIMDPGKYEPILDELEKENPEAYIAVLDVSDAQNVEYLWKKLTNKYTLPQKPANLIDSSFIKPFAVLEYTYDSSANRSMLQSYSGSVSMIGEGPLPPPIAEVKPEIDKMQNTGFNFLSWLKKGSHIIEFPVTVYLVHDPSDYDFVMSASQAKKNADQNGGSVFFINWSKPANRALANVLNLPPLSDAHKFTAWEIEESQINEYGYVEGDCAEVAEQPMTLDYLLDASALWGEDRFHYVLPENFDDYFSAENSEDSIVVVGDPLDSDTQALLEKISEEKKDLGHDKRLIIIPFAKNYGVNIDKANFKILQNAIKADLKKLGIKIKSPPSNPLVYEMTYENGELHKATYEPNGFTVFHPDNNLWKQQVINSSQNVLVVVGETGKVWDAAGGAAGTGGWNEQIAQSTQQVKSQLVSDLNEQDGVVKIGNKNVKKLIFISSADFERIWQPDIEALEEMAESNPQGFKQENSMPALYLRSETLPMMFLITGSKGNRSYNVLDGDDIGLPNLAPADKPKETVIKKIKSVGKTGGSTSSGGSPSDIDDLLKKVKENANASSYESSSLGFASAEGSSEPAELGKVHAESANVDIEVGKAQEKAIITSYQIGETESTTEFKSLNADSMLSNSAATLTTEGVTQKKKLGQIATFYYNKLGKKPGNGAAYTYGAMTFTPAGGETIKFFIFITSADFEKAGVDDLSNMSKKEREKAINKITDSIFKNMANWLGTSKLPKSDQFTVKEVLKTIVATLIDSLVEQRSEAIKLSG